MPFQSEAQRRFLWANHPEIAERWAHGSYLTDDYVNLLLQKQAEIEQIQRFVLMNHTAYQTGKAPVTAVYKEIRKRMAEVEAASREFYSNAIPRIYAEGVKLGTKASYTFDQSDKDILTEIQRRGLADVTLMQHAVEQDQRRFMKMVRDSKDPIPRPGKTKSNVLWMLEGPKGSLGTMEQNSILKRHGIKAIKFQDGKRYAVGDFGATSAKANANSAFNLGSLNAAKRKGIEVVQVTDGAECGWTTHGDSDKADGTIRTIEEAMAFPTAHPNCVRKFIPRPDLGPKDAKKPDHLVRNIAIASGAVASAALVTGSALAIKYDALDWIEQKLKFRAFQGDVWAQYFIRQINAAKGFFSNIGDLADVDVGQFRLIALNRLGPVTPGNFDPNEPFLRQIVGDVMTGADRFAHGVGDVSERVRKAIGAGANATEQELMARFKLFATLDYKLRHTDFPIEKLADVIQFEARRRGLTQLRLFEDSQYRSGLIGTLTQYGARVRIDMTEWLRGRLTLTPTGTIRSLTTKAVGGVKANIKMFQDGTLGGHISFIPKGMFRALVEIDPYGNLVGNIRLVPKGPVKVLLEFQLKGFSARAVGSLEARGSILEQLTKAVDAAAARATEAASRVQGLGVRIAANPGDLSLQKLFDDAIQESRRRTALFRTAKERLEKFELLKFNMEDPRLKDLVSDLRQLELKRVLIDYKIFKMGPAEISGRLRIPIADIRAALKTTENQLSLVKDASGGYTGIFRINAPKEILDSLVNLAKNNTIYGSVKFQRLETQIRSVIHLGDLRLQSIATSMRIRGYTVFDISNILGLKVQDVVGLVDERVAQVQNFMIRLGVRKIEDVGPVFNMRIMEAKHTLNFAFDMNRQEIIQRAIHVMNGDRISEGGNQLLRILARIDQKDGPAVIEQKLWELRSYLMTDQLDHMAELGDLPGAENYMAILEGLKRKSIANLAKRMSLRNLQSSIIPDPLSEIFIRAKKYLEQVRRDGFIVPKSLGFFGYELQRTVNTAMTFTIKNVLADAQDFLSHPRMRWDNIEDMLKKIPARIRQDLNAELEKWKAIINPEEFFRRIDQEVKMGMSGSRSQFAIWNLPDQASARFGKDFIWVDGDVNPRARAAAEKATAMVRSRFPNLPSVNIRFDQPESWTPRNVMAWHTEDDQTIHLSPYWFTEANWPRMELALTRADRIGWFSHKSLDPTAQIIHEWGHHVDQMADDWWLEKGLKWEGNRTGPRPEAWHEKVLTGIAEVFHTDPNRFLRFFQSWEFSGLLINLDPLLKQMIVRNVSHYATSNQNEFFAELFAMLMYQPSGRRLEMLANMEEMLEEAFGGRVPL